MVTDAEPAETGQSPKSDDQTFFDDIEGYPGSLSVAPGEHLDLHVSTRATSWSVRIERWGAQRSVVYEESGLPGEFHTPPEDADANGCGWPVAQQVPVADDWSSGFYLVTLTADGADPSRAVAHAGFVVRGEGASTLYVVPTNTWNAYNTWGGKSLYTGGTAVSFHRPLARGFLSRPGVEDERDDRKARPTRFGEIPDADGEVFQEYRTKNNYPSGIGSTGWYSHGRRFVEWAEADGFAFDYAVSSDLETVPGLLDRYETVVLVGHDEYWSAPERAALEAHVAGGGRLVSFSGNTIFWRVRRSSGTNSGPTMVCHKYASLPDPDNPDSAGDLAEQDPLHPGPITGMWADPLVDEPEWTLLGAGSAFGLYHRFGQATPQGVGGYLISRPEHWLLAGTGLRYGDVLGRDHGVVGYETVGCPLTLDDYHQPQPSEDSLRRGVPANTEIVGWVPSGNVGVGEYPKSIAALSDQGDLEFIAERVFADDPDPIRRARQGNSVLATVGNNVVTVGTTDWVFGLADDAQVAQITRNALSGRGRGAE